GAPVPEHPWFGPATRDVAGGTVELLLVPHRKSRALPAGTPDPGTFYVSRNKITLGMLRSFHARRPGELTDTAWYDMWTWADDLPALDISHPDAVAFADRELGARVPTRAQWDTASGRFEKDRGEGPYKEAFGLDSRIAVHKRPTDPLPTRPVPVGTSEDDKS